MIYEINSADIDYCISNGCHCICVSNDTMTTLISSTKELNSIKIINEYQHTEINEIMLSEKWMKPCEGGVK